MKHVAMLILLAMPPCPIAQAEAPSKTNVPVAPDDVVFETDIAYRKGHGRWMLNVIRPKKDSAKPRAVIMLVHGGGWSMGDHYRFSKMGFSFAQKGYVVIMPTYRMIKDAPFPACIHDVNNAIRWVRAHAKKYNIDPERIGAYGNSAGGTLSLTAAITKKNDNLEGDGSYQEYSSDLQAVVCSGAVGDMSHPNHSKLAARVYRNLAGGLIRGTPESQIKSVMHQASPSSYIRKDTPPILLVHGAKDSIVFIDSTDAFARKMKEVGADLTYLRFEDAGHAVMGQKGEKTMPAMYAFFEKHLQHQHKER